MLVGGKGRGYLIALVTVAWMVGIEWAAVRYFDDRQYYAEHGWPKLLACWASAATVLLMRRELGVAEPDDSPYGAVAPITPDPHPVPEAESQLFYIRARYWPAILFVLGIALSRL